jgi:hypothetical protein
MCGGLASPDRNALALNFAYPIAKGDWAERRFDEKCARLKSCIC